IANTVARPRLPFVGLIARRVDAGRYAELERIYGPAIGVQGRFAPGGCPPGVLKSANLSVLGGAVATLARGWWRSSHAPSAFFDENGRARAEAMILSREQRE